MGPSIVSRLVPKCELPHFSQQKTLLTVVFMGFLLRFIYGTEHGVQPCSVQIRLFTYSRVEDDRSALYAWILVSVPFRVAAPVCAHKGRLSCAVSFVVCFTEDSPKMAKG